jgi:cytohesin
MQEISEQNIVQLGNNAYEDNEDEKIRECLEKKQKNTHFATQPDLLIKAIHKFNTIPGNGIKYILENNILGEDKLAYFLYDNKEMLDKGKIGEYLGELGSIEVLKDFVNLQDFSNQRFDEALRCFLMTFRLPGEAQKIDRIMELFALRYCEDNPQSSFSQDAAYIFAFSIIMLNTDLHNPSVKNKIKKQTFIRNNQKVLPSLPKDVFTNVYNSILNEPLKMFDEDSSSGCAFYLSLFSPDREGWLTKQGGRYKNWKRRYCVLTGSCLYYFKEDLNKNVNQNPLGIIPLENLLVEEEPSESSKKKKFKLFYPYRNNNEDNSRIKAAKTTQNGVIVEGFHSSYVFYCDTDDERQDWINSIRAQMNSSPMYLLYNLRRTKMESNMMLYDDKISGEYFSENSDTNNNCDDNNQIIQ